MWVDITYKPHLHCLNGLEHGLADCCQFDWSRIIAATTQLNGHMRLIQIYVASLILKAPCSTNDLLGSTRLDVFVSRCLGVVHWCMGTDVGLQHPIGLPAAGRDVPKLWLPAPIQRLLLQNDTDSVCYT
jgi:hypothetical protein